MKYLGILLVLIGLVDLIGSFMGFDLWGGFLGIELPELLWKYSAYLEMAAGYLLFKVGSPDEEAATAEANES